MTPWHLGRLGVLDLETTAPDPTIALTVTACVGMVGGGQNPSLDSWLINPGVDIPAEATAIHGITTERAHADGVKAAGGVDDILNALAEVANLGLPVVAYNAVFDLTVLEWEAGRHGLKPLTARITEPLRVICPFVIDKAVDRYRPGKRTLTAACDHYRVALDDAHDATHDALAAARVAYRLGQRAHMDSEMLTGLYADRRYPNKIVEAFRALGGLTLDKLHTAQGGWYAEQTRSFGQYLRQQAEQKRAEAGRDETSDEDREIALREAAELDTRVDAMDTSWPVRAFVATEVAA